MTILRHLILSLIASMLGLYLTDYFLDGVCMVATSGATTCTAPAFSWQVLILGALVLMVVNGIIRPLLGLFALPFIVLTFGLFTFVVNAFAFWLVVMLVNTLSIGGSLVVAGGFLMYVWAGIILGLLNSLAHWLFQGK